MADEGMLRPLEQLDRRADLHDIAVMHDDDGVGEGQRLGLVVGDVDHRAADAGVQLLQLRAQLPFQMRVDHRQRLVEHDDIDVLAHQAAPERDLLLAVRGQPCGALMQHRRQVGHLGDVSTRRLMSASAMPRLRKGKARLSYTVMVS